MPNARLIYRWLRRPLRGVVQLTRYREYVLFVTVTTLFGAKFGGGEFDLRLLIVWAANMLVVAFAFMYNDVEDAPDDALDVRKAQRNPISAGMLSATTGRLICAVTALVTLGLYALLGGMTFLLGVLSLALAFLYSWRRARLKAVPLADLAVHSLSLAGLQFLCAYFAFDQGKPHSWVFFLFAVLISVYGELNNELRDLAVDRRAGIRHTAHWLGARGTKLLMMVVLGAALVMLGLFLWLEMIPLWLVIVPITVSPMLFAEQMWRLLRCRCLPMEQREVMHEPALVTGLLTVLAWFVGEQLLF